MQTQYLNSLLTTAPEWGLPIDSTTGQFGNAGEPSRFLSLLDTCVDVPTITSGWTVLASAVVSDNTVRDNMIKGVYNHANYNQTVGVFPERYNVATNDARNGYAG